MERIRVLLVDDSHDFLEGLLGWFAQDPLIEVVGAVDAGREALDEVRRLRPDLVILDVRIAPMGGFEAARLIKTILPDSVVVLTSFHSNEAARRVAAATGGDRFLAKSEVVEALGPIALEMLERRRAAKESCS
jgi:DNA-binding NarL/FixJ family response regulator